MIAKIHPLKPSVLLVVRRLPDVLHNLGEGLESARQRLLVVRGDVSQEVASSEKDMLIDEAVALVGAVMESMKALEDEIRWVQV